MTDASITAIKSFLVITAVLLVALSGWSRILREPNATNPTTPASPKIAALTTAPAILVITAVLLVAWWGWSRFAHEPEVTHSAITASPKIATLTTAPAATRAGAVAPTAKTPLPGVAIPPGTLLTFAEALTKLSLTDKEYVKAANSRLYGALDYHSIRELQWKLERGFPTIEEMLALRGQRCHRPWKGSKLIC